MFRNNGHKQPYFIQVAGEKPVCLLFRATIVAILRFDDRGDIGYEYCYRRNNDKI
jgi:hypothetical protein